MTRGAMVPQTGLAGSGLLIPVTGPDGVGARSVIALARAAFAGNPAVVFARPVTSDPAGGQMAVSAPAFAALERAEAFIATWRAGGGAQAIATSVLDDIAARRVVVVRVPPNVVPVLRRRIANVHAVLLTAPDDVLARRRIDLGRPAPSAHELAAVRVAPPVTVIDASGALADSADHFIALLASYVPLPEGLPSRPTNGDG